MKYLILFVLLLWEVDCRHTTPNPVGLPIPQPKKSLTRTYRDTGRLKKRSTFNLPKDMDDAYRERIREYQFRSKLNLKYKDMCCIQKYKN